MMNDEVSESTILLCEQLFDGSTVKRGIVSRWSLAFRRIRMENDLSPECGVDEGLLSTASTADTTQTALGPGTRIGHYDYPTGPGTGSCASLPAQGPATAGTSPSFS